ncbi:MAG TPA: sodium-dependent bicarbonate transport family permease [Tepidisphaeraceae bacterium]|jgi:hypothetical protein
MDTLDLLRSNLLSPMVLAFVLGLVAVAVRSDLKFPSELYTGLSIFLLLAIGLKGGHELAKAPLKAVFWPALATQVAGVLIPLVAYALLRRPGGFGVSDAAALAAHYGSVSAVTFAATLTFLDTKGVPYEGFLPALVAMLEVPAIVVALLLAQWNERPDPAAPPRPWGRVLHEVFAGRSVVLLLGGLAIGFVSTEKNFERVAPAFVNLFYGALVLFLLDMGMVAAKRLREVGQAGAFLIAFALLMPVINGMFGVLLGHWAGLSTGGTTVFGVLCASASYIAAPAAVRVALPNANPAYYLTASIGLTFPFNLTVGIPLIYSIARWVTGG